MSVLNPANLSINRDFIFYYNHYAYHLTKKEYMLDIVIQGLKPLCGENSKCVGDTRKAIYFFDKLRFLYDWVDALYSREDADQLELLRFNLKRRKYHFLSQCEGYVERKIPPEKIEYAVLSDSRLKWKSLQLYEVSMN